MKAAKKETTELEKMTTKELSAKFTELTGESTRCPNRRFLIRRIIEAAKPKASESSASGEGGGAEKKLKDLDVPSLRSLYLEVIGRPSGSSNKTYLAWKIQEARRGHVPVGPRKNARPEGVTFKVLPFRASTELIDKLDEAWKRLGLRSRADLFRKALHAFLKNAGETETAAMLAGTDA